jgi:hypothetical protein
MRQFLTMAGLLANILFLGACGHSGAKTPSADTSSVMGPAPDNNSANNPSLADTAYEKNRTKPITDTMKKK